MKLISLRQTFDRHHLAAFYLRGKDQARIHRPPVQQHGAGAAFALLAPALHSEKSFPPQHIQQKVTWRNCPFSDCAIHRHTQWHGFHNVCPASSPHSSRARPASTRLKSRRNSADARRSLTGLTSRITWSPASASSV